MLIKVPRGWEIPEREATPEAIFLERRRFLKAMGLLGLGALAGCRAASPADTRGLKPEGRYPARRNPKFTLDRPLTDEEIAASYNNFYEFSMEKDQVRRLVGRFKVYPWQVKVKGLVKKPRTFEIDELLRLMPLEERLYRFRCVEAWAMAVPWTGFPMSEFIKLVEPLSSARYIRMVSFDRPEEAPGQVEYHWYPWPYYEGLTMEEAMNELTILATGIYGHPLPKQHGAPLRLVVPWKYGFKSIKSIVLLEFTEKRPPNFWNTVAPHEYDFWANVDPRVPHPRWSQAVERMIGTGEVRRTLLYNGYAQYVARLYPWIKV